MENPTWGSLEKSQVDPSTIDEEIDTKIQDHLDDPDAHIETGQSLQSHKAAEIIDHVVGSVLADKLTMTEISGTLFFESLDQWNVTGVIDNDVFPGVRIIPEWGYNNECSLKSTPLVPSDFLSTGYDMLYQTMIRSDDEVDHLNSWFGYLEDYVSGEYGYGFQIRNGVLYCHYKNDTDSYNFEVEDINLNSDHLYRVQYNATTRIITWYIDGSAVTSFEIDSESYFGTDLGPSVGVILTGDYGVSLLCGFITFSRGI
jgi:hypothetical protein